MGQCDLKVISWNVNGVRNRLADIHYCITKYSTDVLLLQETLDRGESWLKLNGYQCYHLPAGDGVRGLSTYVKKSLPSELVGRPVREEGIESLVIRIYVKDAVLNVVNLYVSKNCFDVAYLPDCIFSEVTLLAGDLNAKHNQLGDLKGNNNGAAFYQFLQDYDDVILLGDASATHIKGGRLDYACIFNGQGLTGQCHLQPELLSDHFALAVTLPVEKRHSMSRRKRIMLPKSPDNIARFVRNIARWYNNYTPIDLDTFYEDLRSKVEEFLYNGERTSCHGVTHKRKETYTDDVIVKKWNRLLRAAHKKWVQLGKSDATKEVLLETAKICGTVRKEARGDYWERFANHTGRSKNTHEIWRQVNKVRGKGHQSVMHPDPSAAANQMTDHWSQASSIDDLPADIKVGVSSWEGVRRGLIVSALNMGGPTCAYITQEELLLAIKHGKSTAPGEDGVTYDVLNCLASIEDGPLLHLFNRSYREGRLPRAWKKAIIILIPKAGGGFRPVSLTSCFSKMMERIVLGRLRYIIDDCLHPSLYGFMKDKGTTGALINCLSNESDYCRTFIDLKGAFDRANGEIILYELANMGVTGRLLHWIGDYLHGRTARVCYQGASSSEKRLELGTPQGGVLSPTLFNVLMNRVAKEQLATGVSATIYADDILLQSKNMTNMQEALNTFATLTQRLGLVINENKTKFMCRSKGKHDLHINGKAIERVKTYKYLGVYVGYTAESKEAEVNHLTTQSRSRLRPIKALAWSGRGVGVPILRMLYLSTIRSLIEYACPVLSCFDGNRITKLERLQNEAMRVILNCPRNAMIYAMRCELNLPSISNIISEVNTVGAVRHLRIQTNSSLRGRITAILDTEGSRRQRKSYFRELVGNFNSYGISDTDLTPVQRVKCAPWEEDRVNVIIKQLPYKKHNYVVGELKGHYEASISELAESGVTHVYCDGSVRDDGRAGCGVLMRRVTKNGGHVDTEQYYRVTDHVSSTQAELCALYFALTLLQGGVGDVWIFSDSRGALESLVSTKPILESLVSLCKVLIKRLKMSRRVVFMWVPSHVGLQGNEKADKLARKGALKGSIDLQCANTLRQIKTKIRKANIEKERGEVVAQCHKSETLRHYTRVESETNFTYGKYRVPWKDSVCTRLRMGYKYYWQLGVETSDKDRQCRLCAEPNSHTLHHYVLQCPALSQARHPSLTSVTEQVIYMFNNNKITELLNTCKYIKNIC